MNRIDARFKDLGARGRAAFIPFFTAGDPAPETTVELLRRVQDAGADVVELGFPYSDPIADGPTIQDSYHRALRRGLRVGEVFDMVRQARDRCELPIVAMASYSLVFRMGMEDFMDRCLAAGLDGATVPDLPVDEAEPFFTMAKERDFRLVCFATPATSEHRRELVIEHAHGFIYYIAVRGTTGERTELPPDLVDNLAALKRRTEVPVTVGFGISRPDQAAAVAGHADGVIVGSAIVKRMAAAANAREDPVETALGFIRTMAAATRETN